eukprot:3010721-Prymnesium_polylepis.1
MRGDTRNPDRMAPRFVSLTDLHERGVSLDHIEQPAVEVPGLDRTPSTLKALREVEQTWEQSALYHAAAQRVELCRRMGEGDTALGMTRLVVAECYAEGLVPLDRSATATEISAERIVASADRRVADPAHKLYRAREAAASGKIYYLQNVAPPGMIVAPVPSTLGLMSVGMDVEAPPQEPVRAEAARSAR